MGRPRLHLICNAHLDPVWQWRWEEGAAEAMATFRNAAALLREHKTFIFNHNEAVLYRWVEEYDPALFREIKRLVKEGRWSISGGWHLQPDLNMPGLESLIRQIAEGRRYFYEKFRIKPRVAYNFDSFGHSGGLPQVLKLSGYKMYIHMRPQKDELELPSDLYRWRGVDGSEILALRIEVGLYHTEVDNIEEKLRAGTALALELGRDVPIFWGLGNHGGGATRQDLGKIDVFMARERRVEVIHSTPDRLYEALRGAGRKAPVVEGDLQRVFTGCYTSLSRVKRRAEESLGALVQTEALRAAAWWMTGLEYPREELGEAWRDHLLNDSHDILTGSCTQPAEADALDLYGKVAETTWRLRLGAAAALNRLVSAPADSPVPITVLNANPGMTKVPVELECMAGYRPFWEGEWHLRVFRLDGREISSQEERTDSLLPFNDWRRKLCFMADLPGVGGASFAVRASRGKKKESRAPAAKSDLNYKIDQNTGLVSALAPRGGRSWLRGPLFEPLVIRDDGDSWGTGCRSYREVGGKFTLGPEPVQVIQQGPIRTIVESVLSYRKSKIVFHTFSYSSWPVLEFRLRIHWNEERAMLKLAVPTVFLRPSVRCEIPGGAIHRPADGEEHVFGRWALVEGQIRGRRAALAVIGSGQHGLDCRDGELRLSVLRSAAYCHERGFRLGRQPSRKYMDQGVHELRFLVTAGESDQVRRSATALADWLNAPPFALAHLPFGGFERPKAKSAVGRKSRSLKLLSLEPSNIRLTACKQSRDGRGLVVRLHETSGRETAACLRFDQPCLTIPLHFRPFEIKTVRLDKTGGWREADLIAET